MKAKALFLPISFAILIYLVFSTGELWWDSAVYIGMGKWIWSFGKNGLFESIRPPFLPLILGFFWRIGISPIFAEKILELAAFIFLIILTYVFGKRFFSKYAALLGASFVALSPTVLKMSGQVYTEIPSVAIGIASIILANAFFSGFFSGIAFLTKFPAALFALPAYLLSKNKKLFLAGIAIPIAIYLILNKIFYGSFLNPLFLANEVVKAGLGCTVLRAKPFWFYFSNALKEGAWFGLAPIGLIFWMRSKRFSIPVFISLLLPLAYFTILPCREARFAIFFIPTLALFSGLAIERLLLKAKASKRAMLLAFLLIVFLAGANAFFKYDKEPVWPRKAGSYFAIASALPPGEIWSSNPVHALFTDRRIEKVYYPVFNSSIANKFALYVKENRSKIGGVLLDNCSGGIICPPSDDACEKSLEEMLSTLDSSLNRFFFFEEGACWFGGWKSNPQ